MESGVPGMMRSPAMASLAAPRLVGTGSLWVPAPPLDAFVELFAIAQDTDSESGSLGSDSDAG